MRKTLILAALAALVLAGAADAKSCKDAHGKFITCPSAAAAQKNAKTEAKAAAKAAKADKAAAKKDAGIAVAASKTANKADMKVAKETGGSPHCTKGKPCGHSCIAVDKVCHK